MIDHKHEDLEDCDNFATLHLVNYTSLLSLPCMNCSHAVFTNYNTARILWNVNHHDMVG